MIEVDRISEIQEFDSEWLNITQDKMVSLLNHLNEQELRLIELKYFENNTFQDMALLLDSKESAVKMKLYRLLKKLKIQLEKYHDTVRL